MSYYPDGTTHPNWQPEVIIRSSQKEQVCTISPANIRLIVSHRNITGKEEYLVKWAGKWGPETPFSWHDLRELQPSLRKVQAYLESLSLNPPTNNQILDLPIHSTPHSRKRKSPGSDDVVDPSHSVSRNSPAISISSGSSSSSVPDADADAYNGTPKRENGVITMVQKPDGTSKRSLPTKVMIDRAAKTSFREALYKIRTEFHIRLSRIPGPPVTLSNDVDDTSPTLKFRFVDTSECGSGVTPADDATVISCGHIKRPGMQTCRPDMGQAIGCEYLLACECMEFAAVAEGKLTPEQKQQYLQGNVEGLPKRFPYFAIEKKRGLLQSQYLNSRATIYECNPRCNCGPNCKTRVVQKGRTVPLEIFKTQDRGWGLRTLVDVQEGQFIDTYRGEIITNEEANRREARAKKEFERTSKHKAVYLYSLDKFVGDAGLTEDDCYVIDGEYIGGPTRYINHSCDPNCRQYAVSYNKYDFKVYNLAFFAYKFIPAGTELTFDYLDKDEPEDVPGSSQQTREDEGDAEEMECKCGSKKCRGKLFM